MPLVPVTMCRDCCDVIFGQETQVPSEALSMLLALENKHTLVYQDGTPITDWLRVRLEGAHA